MRLSVAYSILQLSRPNHCTRGEIMLLRQNQFHHDKTTAKCGCEDPTEGKLSFLDKLLQPIAQMQKSYIKDTRDFINLVERAQIHEDATLVSMDFTSLLTNIPQEEGEEQYVRHPGGGGYSQVYKG